MATYRKVKETVEAMEYTGSQIEEIWTWIGAFAETRGTAPEREAVAQQAGTILAAAPVSNSYILRNEDDTHSYMLKAEFEAQYELDI